MFGQFVEIEDKRMPWAPWKIWVEYDWLDYRCQTLAAKAREILDSGWMNKIKKG